MFNFDLKGAILSLVNLTNSTDVPSSPNIAKPDTNITNLTQNAPVVPRGKVDGMISQSKTQNSQLVAKRDNTPLNYSNTEVELSATAIPEKEKPQVKERKGFKANLMDRVSEQFKGGNSVERANSQSDTGAPNTNLQGDNMQRPTPKTMHMPPNRTPPNPKMNPTPPPNPTIPTHRVPNGNFPKVSIPKWKGPKL